MRLKSYQWAELVGILILLGSSAMQLFYLEPIKREIDWRLVAFNTQQSAQVQLQATFDNQLALLKHLNAPADIVAGTEARRASTLDRYKASDANISDYMLKKEHVEGYLEMIVIALFATGSILAGIGRVLEMQASPEGR